MKLFNNKIEEKILHLKCHNIRKEQQDISMLKIQFKFAFESH